MGISVRNVGKTENPLAKVLFKIIGLSILDALTLYICYQLFAIGDQTSLFLALAIALLTIVFNVVWWREDLYPLRWFTPGIILLTLLVVYPVLFTFYIAFTNYGTGHLLTKAQAISQFERQTFTPEGGITYSWAAFRNDTNPDDFLIWFQTPDTDDFLASRTDVIELADVNAGALDADGIPESIPGYTRLPRAQLLRLLPTLTEGVWGDEERGGSITSLNAASPRLQRYIYNAETDTLTDQETGKIFTPVRGTFTADDGTTLSPGFYVVTGVNNFVRVFTDARLRDPFIRVFLWTLAFAFFTVLTTFALGLFLAMVFNDPTLPGRKIIRSILLIPYAIPAFITVQMWVGLLNPEFGVVSTFITQLVGFKIQWFSDPWMAKVGIILVNLWLGFPYMMLICTGALQTIPGDLYQAAEVDGANVWQKFTSITLPLLLVAVGPLLIGSFAFNFNNFTVIDVYNQGGPPIPNTPTPAGHTDILISYTFRLAFAGGRGVDYGLASAVTIVIFVILAVLTAFQFRYTRIWEEVSENV